MRPSPFGLAMKLDPTPRFPAQSEAGDPYRAQSLRAADVEIAEAQAVRVIPHERGVRLEAVQTVAEVGRVALTKGRIQPLPLHDVAELDRDAVLVAVVLVLRVEADIEIVVGAVVVDAARSDLPVHAEGPDHQVMVAPVRFERDAPVGRDVGDRVRRAVAVVEQRQGRNGQPLVGGESA